MNGRADVSQALASETPTGRARLAALAAITGTTVTPTSLISYRSRGRLLIIGPAPYALEQAESLCDRLQCVVLATNATATSPHALGDVPVVRADRVNLSGHLGAFSVSASMGGNAVDLGPQGGPGGHGFDLILDLSRPPLIGTELPPPGYYGPDTDKEALYRAVREVPGLVGEFEKPTYLDYDAAICAHGERGVGGCTRCLDVCPSGAITSIGERIAVDAHLCHGVGSCSAVCPTGAIRYAYPKPAETIGQIRKLLGVFAKGSGSRALLLFHDAESGSSQVERMVLRMPERVIPVQVEDIGAIGLDVWLCALAHGAGAVFLLASDETPGAVLEAVHQQLDVARRVLGGLGFQAEAVQVLRGDDEDLVRAVSATGDFANIARAGFGVFDEKRTMLQLALDHLYEQATAPVSAVALAQGAAFGDLEIDKAACTLCMACVAVCPTAALTSGGEEPRLSFKEWSCVQCGLCQRACPENALELSARLLLEPRARRETRVLHEEPPFCCVRCGKPFATRSVVERITERLKDHEMFRGDALERLQMCEDCRVKDIFFAEQGAP